jgi:hypothetical protein
MRRKISEVINCFFGRITMDMKRGDGITDPFMKHLSFIQAISITGKGFESVDTEQYQKDKKQ